MQENNFDTEEWRMLCENTNPVERASNPWIAIEELDLRSSREDAEEKLLSKIRRYRSLHKLSQTELAQKAGIATEVLQKIENKDFSIALQDFISLVEAMGGAESIAQIIDSKLVAMSKKTLITQEMLERIEKRYAK